MNAHASQLAPPGWRARPGDTISELDWKEERARRGQAGHEAIIAVKALLDESWSAGLGWRLTSLAGQERDIWQARPVQEDRLSLLHRLW